jgi:hypothetical protein
MKNVDTQKVERIIKRFSDEYEKIITQISEIEKQAKQALEQAAEVKKEVMRITEEFQIKWKQEVEAIIAEQAVTPPENMSSVKIIGEYNSMDEYLESQGFSVDFSSFIEGIGDYANEMKDLLTIFAHHSEEYLTFKNRMYGASAAGIIGALAVRRIAAKIAAKQTFKTAVAAVAKMFVKRTMGISGGTGAGAATGGTIGSVVPVIGTTAGAVVGGIIGGVGTWIASDYVFVKLEEHISREKFKQEILSGIREQKVEVMKALENMFQVKDTSVSQTPDETNKE